MESKEGAAPQKLESSSFSMDGCTKRKEAKKPSTYRGLIFLADHLVPYKKQSPCISSANVGNSGRSTTK